MNNVFPALIIVLYLGAAITSGLSQDWRNAVYSVLCGLLNVVVYFWRA